MVPTLIVVFGVFQLILWLMHAVIYKTIVFAFGLNWPWLEWLFIVLSISFVSSSILVFRSCNVLVTWYYRIAAYWFGLTQFLFVGSVIIFVIEYIADIHAYYIPPALVGGVCLGGMFLLDPFLRDLADSSSTMDAHIRYFAKLAVGMAW